MYLFLHELGHTMMYALLAFIVYKSLKLTRLPLKELIVGFLTTIGLDADHLFDYFLHVNFSRFNISEFLSARYFEQSGHIFIPLHAWEWFLLVLCIFYLTKKKYTVLLFIAAGILAQLIFDTISHGFDPRVYSIIYRASLRFPQKIFFPVLY